MKVDFNFTQFCTIPHNSIQFHTIPHNYTQLHTIPSNSVEFRTTKFCKETVNAVHPVNSISINRNQVFVYFDEEDSITLIIGRSISLPIQHNSKVCQMIAKAYSLISC